MKKYEKEIREYLKERKWDELRPADIAKSISIESAELLEIFQWTNRDATEITRDAGEMEKIKSELADVLIYCLDMSVILGLDTGKIILEKLEKVKKKYPASLFLDRDNAVDAGTEKVYLDIKKRHRGRR